MARNTVTAATETALQKALLEQLRKLNTGLDTTTLRNIVNAVTSKQSQSLVSSVYKTGNSQLNSIPSKLVGTKNPVDIVSSNFGSAGIFNNLSNSIDTQLSPQATEKLIAELRTQLVNTLPPNSPALASFNNQINSLTRSLSPSVSKVVNSTFKSFTDGVFSNPPSVKSLLKGLPNIFGTASRAGSGIAGALAAIDLNFSNSLASDVLNQVQNFNVNNPENNDKMIAVKQGFMDPSATYPTKEYAGQPETNKLARGEVTGTVVQKKNNDRVVGAKLPYNDSFSEPLSPFNGVYPYNKVTQTESGHIIEVDDTPGNERLHVYHRSGTYIEIDSNGSVVKRTRGSSYEIVDCNGKIAILGKADISINGACNIFVGNDANMEVMGDVNLTCHNDITALAGGKMHLSAKEEINIHSTNINIEADNALNILSDGIAKVTSGKDMHLKSNTNAFIATDQAFHLKANTNSFFYSLQTTHMAGKTGFKVFSEQNLDVKASSGLNMQSGSTTNVKSGSGLNLQSGSATNIKAGGRFNADGSQIFLNSGASGSAGSADQATPANAATPAKVSNIGLLDGRRYSDPVSITDPEPIRYDARYTEASEGAELTASQLNEQKDRLVLTGIASKDELEDPNPVVIKEESPSSTQSKILMPDQKLLSVTELPGNYKLSPNFTLDNMWKTVAVSPGKHVPRAQAGLTYGQIVYNLQALALNVLEPVRALYPKMIVTSAFRHEQDNSTSAHPAGLACDLQFPGASREEYYEIAVKLAKILSYDQVLLEYWVQASNPWIHIGLAPRGLFNPQSQRKVAWTFKDHKLYKQNLVNLA